MHPPLTGVHATPDKTFVFVYFRVKYIAARQSDHTTAVQVGLAHLG